MSTLFDQDDFSDEDGDTYIFDEEISAQQYAPVDSSVDSLTTQLLGHTKNEAHVLDLIAQDKMPHGLILVGPKGIGKRLFAMKLARTLLAHVDKAVDTGPSLFGDEAPQEIKLPTFDIAPDHPVARLMAAGSHPDFMLLGSTRAEDDDGDKPVDRSVDTTIPVDDIRKINAFLHLKPATEGGWRVVVIDNAETMNRNAQNALLKILEEPPEKTLIVLVAHQLGALLPTIRSRARLLTFSALDEGDFDRALQAMNLGVPATHTAWVRALAGGCPGQAAGWANPKGLALIDDFLALWPSRAPFDEALWQNFTEKLLAKRDDDGPYYFVLSLWLWLARAALRAKVDPKTQPDLVALLADRPGFGHMIDTYSLRAWIAICDGLAAHFGKIKSAALEKRQGFYSARLIMTEQIG